MGKTAISIPLTEGGRGEFKSLASSQTSPKTKSGAELETALRAYIDAVDEYPKPFRATKSADHILAATKRLCLKNPRNRLIPNRNRTKLRIKILDRG